MIDFSIFSKCRITDNPTTRKILDYADNSAT